jgi:transcription-repair coupling factor (superfamily II helicase)
MKKTEETVGVKILARVLGSPATKTIERASLEPGEAGFHTPESVLPLACSAAYRLLGGPMVVAVSDEPGELAEDISCFLPGEVFHLPGPGAAGDWFRPYDEAVGRRLEAARALRRGGMVVAGIQALLGGVPGELPEPWPLRVAPGMEIDPEAMLSLLVEAGYQREYQVEGWGRFALRGGILDIFPSTADRPVRIELVGDTVESLREFNVVTQRSSSLLDEVELLPASDAVASCGGSPQAKLLAINPPTIEAKATDFKIEIGEESPPEPILDRWGVPLRVDTVESAGLESFGGGPVREFRGDLQAAAKEWARLEREGDDVYLLLEGGGQVERAREIWHEASFDQPEPLMGTGSLRRGFRIADANLSLFTSADLLGRRKRFPRRRRVSSGTPVSSYAELEVGGYVVHVDQGIGVYRGLTSREVLGVTREYLLVEYAGGDRLYVPTAQLAKVQRYVGAENPTVHRLRGREWSRSRKTARRSAEKTARELLQLYVETKSRKGHGFAKDTPWQREMEESFEHRDTPDQARASLEVKEDMESESAMDRLVCGDVGYGKTEVAVRAAMKAVMDSKQVAVLVPTTVLASQHCETFSDRLAPFPITVRVLSRFLSREEQLEVVEGVERGRVDVVIGTHRLLQEDVGFKDLGLLVVDEEQKFGVSHKEMLRRLRRNVDTLTLTATPIPRTLQMSLSGVKDISIIDTPPEDRRPVATYVGEFDMELVKHAVKHETARGGQAFYVHNRIESIGGVAETLRRALDGVSVAVAHGRMDEDALEKVMMEFAEGLHDLLVCTTIVESGLDLPNVNTLVVDRADRLGLAQMYQIRGRVGRSGRRAYSYFFYPRRETLTDTAVSRLATISEMTPLGSGMRVAMRDLEIRGAGNLLGAEQSGQIEAVGFELYCELLRESVDLLKGERRRPPPEAVVELPVDAYIPEGYILDEETRVEEYRRMLVAGRSDTLDAFSSELEDRFGPPPVPVEQMLTVERLRRKFGFAGFEAVTAGTREIRFKCFSGREQALAMMKGSALREGACLPEDTYIDEVAGTLYLKLRFGEVKDRQELLLKWLNTTIDDIIRNGHQQRK